MSDYHVVREGCMAHRHNPVSRQFVWFGAATAAVILAGTFVVRPTYFSAAGPTTRQYDHRNGAL
jgi:hypothetical protein